MCDTAVVASLGELWRQSTSGQLSSRTPTPPEVERVAPEQTPNEKPEPVITAKGTRDITDRIPRLGSETEEINERITLVAHDLKTPLSIILLETELLQHRLSAVQSAAIQKSLDRITQNAAYIDRLVADLLDLDAELQLRLERIDLAILLRETIDRAVSSVDRNRVQLDVRCNACDVNADRNRLERVIANFISNALKYSTAPVWAVLELAGQRVRVTVIDHGRGMTTEQSERIFERYQRGPTRGRDGYGLGLYISRKIIDAHGGQIGVVSEPGSGSQFFFELDVLE